jgi:hypothetical protein
MMGAAGNQRLGVGRVGIRFAGADAADAGKCFQDRRRAATACALDQAQLRHLIVVAVEPVASKRTGAVKECIDGTRKRVVARTCP